VGNKEKEVSTLWDAVNREVETNYSNNHKLYY
jgi:hypothetical protein